MDPALAAALIKLVVGASGSLGGKLTGLLWNAAKRDRHALPYPHNKVDLQKIENQLLSVSLTELPLEAPPAYIYEFVTSPVLATLTEQLILVGIAGARPSLERAMREELHASMSAYLGPSRDEAVRLHETDVIFTALSELTQAAVIALKEVGYRLTDEALQRLHNLVLELYTSSIERNTRLLSGARPENRERIDDFLGRLRAQVAFRYRNLEPPDFERIVRIPIENLYVSPHLSEGIQPSRYAAAELNLTSFGAQIYRSVVLGDPGGGKSTLSAFLAHTIGNGTFRQDIFATKTPIIIVLRDMKMSESGPESILQYIEAICDSSYALRPPPNAIEYALLNGRFFLLFDGLDELLDPTGRGKVVEAIEAVGNLYPNTFILVTSRRINYEAAPLDSTIFETFSLNEFDDSRIEEYAYKSFGQLVDKTDEERQKAARAFLRESRDHAAEIRSNPLVLALMCRLYRGENYIPQNIPSLYQRCANMLFFTWDARRHIGPGLPFEYHIEPLMAHLAYWIFESGEVAVSETAVVAHAKEYLIEWLISDPREAEAAAIAFVKYFKNRLWVFSEVGLTEDGESLYFFTHRTFLEYFAGMYLSTNATSSAALATRLLPRLEANEWSVVAQVAVYLRTRAEVRAADEIIHVLLRAAEREGTARANLLGFVIRLLAFVVPRPETLTQIVHATLNFIIRNIRQGEPKWPLLVSLARTRADNRPGITKSVLSYIEGILNEPIDQAIIAVGSILQLPKVLATNVVGDASYISELLAFWETIGEAVVTMAGASIRSWARDDFTLAIQAWRAGALNLHDLASMYGTQSIFRRGLEHLSSEYELSDQWRGPVGSEESWLVLEREPFQILPDLLRELGRTRADLVRALEEWHDEALSLPTPWFDTEWLVAPELPPFMLYDLADSNKAFGSVALIMTAFYEAGASAIINAASLGDLDSFKDLFSSREYVLDTEAIARQLDSLTDLATYDCLELLRGWVRRRVDLCYERGNGTLS